jgi:hypothetical protein
MMTPARDRTPMRSPSKRESEPIIVEGPLQPHTPLYGKEISQRPGSASCLAFGCTGGAVSGKIVGRSNRPCCLVRRLRGVVMKSKRASGRSGKQ